MIALALALRVVRGVAFTFHATVRRADATGAARCVTARCVAKSHAGHARLALRVLERLVSRLVSRIVAVPVPVVARPAHPGTDRTLGAAANVQRRYVILSVHHWSRFAQHLKSEKRHVICN